MTEIPRRVHKAPLLPIPVQGAFDRIAMDALGCFPPSHDGNRYIILFSDYYTRWPEAFLPYTMFNVLSYILYQSQTDGLVERFNGTLTEALFMYVSTNQKY